MSFKASRPVLALSACCTIWACGPNEPTQDVTFARMDSAGVSIKEFATPKSWNAPVALTEVTRIGTSDGAPPTLFTKISAGRILGETLVLADRGSGEVRTFSTDGKFLSSQGRLGEGPGEYKFIIGMGQCAPSGFTVFDIGWSMSLYDEAGSFLSEQTPRLEGGSTPYNLACDASGRLAVVNWDLRDSSQGPTLGFYTAKARLQIIRPEGESALDLGERIGSERFGRPTGSGPHPAGRATKFDFAETDLIVTDGSFFGFERWDTAGRLSEIVRIGSVPPPDIDSLMAEYLERTLERASDEEERTRWRQQVLEMTGPEQAAYSSDLFVSHDHVLLREPSVRGSGRWFAFDIDGTPHGYLPLPSGSELLDFREGLLLVAVEDDMGVQRAVLFEVTPTQ